MDHLCFMSYSFLGHLSLLYPPRHTLNKNAILSTRTISTPVHCEKPRAYFILYNGYNIFRLSASRGRWLLLEECRTQNPYTNVFQTRRCRLNLDPSTAHRENPPPNDAKFAPGITRGPALYTPRMGQK